MKGDTLMGTVLAIGTTTSTQTKYGSGVTMTTRL